MQARCRAMQAERWIIGHQSNDFSAVLCQNDSQLRFGITQQVFKNRGIQFCVIVVKGAQRLDLGANNIGVLCAGCLLYTSDAADE